MSKFTHYIRLPGGMVMQVGRWSFTGTDTSVEVPTKLQTLVSGHGAPLTYTGLPVAGGEAIFISHVVSAGKVTVYRKVAVDSNLEFSYLFVGNYGSAGGG